MHAMTPSAWFSAGVILQLFSELSPGQGASKELFCWRKVWAAFLFTNAVLPLCAAYTWLAPDVVWSGVRYHKRGGRIVRVQHEGKRREL